MRGHSQASHAKVVVHRTKHGSMKRENTQTTQLSRIKTGSTLRHSRVNSQRTATTTRFQSPRSSMNSLHSSRQGTPYVRPASRHKRGVDFSQIKRKSTDYYAERRRRGPHGFIGENEHYERPISPTSTEKKTSVMDRPRPKLKIVRPQDPVFVVNEEVRSFTNSIAKDCDEAFNSFMADDEASELGANDGVNGKRDSTGLSLDLATPSSGTPSNPFHPWDTRPLPALPNPKSTASSSPKIEKTGRNRNQQKDAQPTGRVGKFVDQVNRLGFPALLPKQERRISSAPPHGQNNKVSDRLPAINENGRDSVSSYHRGEGNRNRIVSAPPKTPRGHTDRDGLDYLVRAGETIRVVNSPSATSPIPKPLNVRKKTMGKSINYDQVDGRHIYMHGASGMDELPTPSTATRSSGPTKQKKSWFKRSSKDSTSGDGSVHTQTTQETQPYSMTTQSTAPSRSEIKPNDPPRPVAAKKKGFGLLFWKSHKEKTVGKMSIAGTRWSPSIKLVEYGQLTCFRRPRL